MSQPAGGEDHGSRLDHPKPVAVSHEHAAYALGPDEDVVHDVATADVQHRCRVIKRTLYFRARRIATGVDDAPRAMPALTGQCPLTRTRFIESRAVGDQIAYRPVSVGHDGPDRLGIT
ncbi:Uncharacterised protein [Mycobacteroides abscessus subsp. abscessus]|nr:Uncharacterised protein [Mycobacteroides abscessus subsp. abscessus]